MRKFYKIFYPKMYVWYYHILKGSGVRALKDQIVWTIIGTTRHYNKWLKGHYPSDEEIALQQKKSFDYSPLISIIVPTYNTPEQYLLDMLNSVKEQTYSNWELCIADGSSSNTVKKIIDSYTKEDNRIKFKTLDSNKGIAENTNCALSMASGDYVAFLDHDDVIVKHALYELVSVLQEYHHDLIYTDEDFAHSDLKYFHDPVFKPDWSPDLFLSHNYITHFVAVKKEIVDKIHGLKSEYNGAQDYDFLFRVIENSESIYHIPKVLYHWRVNKNSVAAGAENKMYAYENGRRAIQDYANREGINGKAKIKEILGYYDFIYDTPGNPLVSIIIPNKDHIDDLEKCIKSLYENNNYKNFEVIVVENNSTNKETFQFYEQIKNNYSSLRVLEYSEEFNFSKINNFAVEQAKGDYLLFLNNDTEMINPDSLTQMLGNCMRDDVGIVGAKLLFEDETIQHAGAVLGFGGFAGHVFTEQDQDSKGYMLRPLITCNYSAVTGACMLIKKTLFNKVGGFNEDFKVGLNDIDLCLRVRKEGKVIVYNANTLWFHYESKSRGYEDTPKKKKRLNNEIKLFRKIWKKELDAGDPYYSPNFSLKFIPYEKLNVNG